MRMRPTTTVTVTVLLVLLALGTADAVLIENARLLQSMETDEPPDPAPPPAMAVSSSAQSSSAPVTGTPKNRGPNVLEILSVSNFRFTDPGRERSLIEQIIPSDVAEIQTKVLLQEDDRAGLISWTESPEVKVYFLALKEALHSTFSPEVRDLVDEVQQREGRPPRNLLTFLDPAINEERVVFIRVRERLYEFHVAAGREDTIFDLIEALTR